MGSSLVVLFLLVILVGVGLHLAPMDAQFKQYVYYFLGFMMLLILLAMIGVLPMPKGLTALIVARIPPMPAHVSYLLFGHV